ncbi:MAG TPA: hypothetical protein VJZ93_02345 [Candidatus Nanoarchaeia archaeon]|nr:hypothetical protein [Candidatus Nanoarchaeia archaeon]
MVKEEIKRAVIAGAASALNYIRKNKNASHEDALKHVAKEMGEILRNIEDRD